MIQWRPLILTSFLGNSAIPNCRQSRSRATLVLDVYNYPSSWLPAIAISVSNSCCFMLSYYENKYLRKFCLSSMPNFLWYKGIDFHSLLYLQMGSDMGRSIDSNLQCFIIQFIRFATTLRQQLCTIAHSFCRYQRWKIWIPVNPYSRTCTDRVTLRVTFVNRDTHIDIENPTPAARTTEGSETITCLPKTREGHESTRPTKPRSTGTVSFRSEQAFILPWLLIDSPAPLQDSKGSRRDAAGRLARSDQIRAIDFRAPVNPKSA